MDGVALLAERKERKEKGKKVGQESLPSEMMKKGGERSFPLGKFGKEAHSHQIVVVWGAGKTRG